MPTRQKKLSASALPATRPANVMAQALADQRFRPKRVEDKKRLDAKLACRKKISRGCYDSSADFFMAQSAAKASGVPARATNPLVCDLRTPLGFRHCNAVAKNVAFQAVGVVNNVTSKLIGWGKSYSFC